MNGSIISLIQEKRKLFYTGVIRNSYKEASPESSIQNDGGHFKGMESEKPNKNFKSRSIQILQEIFSE